jgi:hypothetical protein
MLDEGIITYIIDRYIAGKENTPEGGVYFVLYVLVLYFVLYLYLAPATRDRCGGRKRDDAVPRTTVWSKTSTGRRRRSSFD